MNHPSGTTNPHLIILDPGHFHASLIQKQMYPGVDAHVSVYGPLAPELLDYLGRVSLFNNRATDPTSWTLDIHTSDDPLGDMLRNETAPVGVVVLAGKNRPKIERVSASVPAGLNVLADKPWIISSSDLGQLEKTLEAAVQRRVIAYDIMTERYEVTSELQRELVNTPAVFGELIRGTEEQPAIFARSVHYVMKIVSAVPLRRPAWFFDIDEYGEGLADVGTHVVDLVQWTAFADQAIDYRKEIDIVDSSRWPLSLSPTQFAAVTGNEDREHGLEYFCNNSVHYLVRGVHVRLEISWDWEAEPGRGDVYEARFRGTRSTIEIRQGVPENHRPEVYVVPENPALQAEVLESLRGAVRDLQSRWPGLSTIESGESARLVIPESFRVGHEAHFGQVTNRFFEYLRSPDSLPTWENPNMLAKYYITTKGVELGRTAARPAAIGARALQN